MPKINVYLPDDLAEAVKEAGVPVSAVCQRALELAVRRAAGLRQAVLGGGGGGEVGEVTLERFTQRARAALKLAGDRMAEAGAAKVGTEHLLDGVLSEGGNLGLQVLRTLEVDPEQLLRALRSLPVTGPGSDDGPERFSASAAVALESAVTEAVSFGHNYVGCEHLLLGLAAEPDGAGGRVLRELGVEPRALRRAVTEALTGILEQRAQVQQAAAASDPRKAIAEAIQQAIAPLAERIDLLERRLGEG